MGPVVPRTLDNLKYEQHHSEKTKKIRYQELFDKHRTKLLFESGLKIFNMITTGNY